MGAGKEITMNRPIVFAACCAISSAVGFIFGATFDDRAKRKEAADRYQETVAIFNAYETVLLDTFFLKDLNEIKSSEDLQSKKSKWQKNLAAHIGMFNAEVTSAKKKSVKQSALAELEASVQKMQADYVPKTP
jgi:hypothetical protein